MPYEGALSQGNLKLPFKIRQVSFTTSMSVMMMKIKSLKCICLKILSLKFQPNSSQNGRDISIYFCSSSFGTPCTMSSKKFKLYDSKLRQGCQMIHKHQSQSFLQGLQAKFKHINTEAPFYEGNLKFWYKLFFFLFSISIDQFKELALILESEYKQVTLNRFPLNTVLQI